MQLNTEITHPPLQLLVVTELERHIAEASAIYVRNPTVCDVVLLRLPSAIFLPRSEALDLSREPSDNIWILV